MRRALVGAVLMTACGGAQEPSTTVRVRVSVTDSPDTVTVVQAAEPRVRRPRAPTPPPRVVTPDAPHGCGFARPADAPPLPDWDGVALGYGHSCARMSDGTVRCWGANLNGEAGTGTTGSERGPSAPSQVRAIEGATQVCTGASYSCALLRDGTARCWGNNSDNQVRFELRASCTATPLAPSVDHIASLACGARHVCALRRDGHVWCWGEHAPNYRPWQVRVPGRVVEVAAGTQRSCARTESNAVWCWTTTERTPVEVQGFTDAPAQLAVAEHFACAVLTSKRVACWGEGYHGELGGGVAAESRTPVVVAGLDDVREVAVAHQRACAVLHDGALWCWGTIARRRGYRREETLEAPQRMGDLGEVDHVFLGERHGCARARTGDLCCWGANYTGQLGRNEVSSPDLVLDPAPVTW